MRIPPLKIKIMVESNPLKSRILVQYGDWPYVEAPGRPPGAKKSIEEGPGLAPIPPTSDLRGTKGVLRKGA